MQKHAAATLLILSNKTIQDVESLPPKFYWTGASQNKFSFCFLFPTNQRTPTTTTTRKATDSCFLPPFPVLSRH